MINQVQSVQAVTPWIFAKDLEIGPWIDLNGKMFKALFYKESRYCVMFWLFQLEKQQNSKTEIDILKVRIS